jgi:hypothetical protein
VKFKEVFSAAGPKANSGKSIATARATWQEPWASLS